MEINKKIEFLLVSALYLFALFVWTLPFQENKLPYGDVDSSNHFTVADYMAKTDRIILRLPYYLLSFAELTGGKLWYPPQFHLGAAIAQIVGGERIVPIFIYISITSSLYILSSYFLIRSLYGFLAAFLSSFLLIFSTRDILVYIWGQWPQAASFAFLPIILLAYYKYIDSFLTGKRKDIYLYITFMLSAAQFLIHPQGFLASALIMFFFTIAILVKEKRFVFKLKPALVSLALFLIITLPFFNFIFATGGTGYAVEITSIGQYKIDIPGIFRWTKAPESPGVSPDYYSFKAMNNGFWALPFLLIGIFVLLSRRSNKDILLLSWLIALYLLFHLQILSISGRAERFIQLEARLFFPLAAIGLLAIPSFFKLPQTYKKYLKYALVILFLVLAINFNGKNAYSQLKSAYSGYLRITPPEYEATAWMSQNLPEDSNTLLAGTVVYPKKKWIRNLAYRKVHYSNDLITKSEIFGNLTKRYVLIDYSDLKALGRDDMINEIQKWEYNSLANATLLYDKNFVKVYKIGT